MCVCVCVGVGGGEGGAGRRAKDRGTQSEDKLANSSK